MYVLCFVLFARSIHCVHLFLLRVQGYEIHMFMPSTRCELTFSLKSVYFNLSRQRWYLHSRNK